MIRTLLTNEWLGMMRNTSFLTLTIFFVLMLAGTTYLGVLDTQLQYRQANEAQQHVREQWENMGPSNPHSAAHYGSYVFKPATPLTSLDEGVNETVGKVLQLEAHVQNEMVYSAQSQSLLQSYFGKLRPSLVLQIILPLLIIFMAFHTMSSEREQGRIRLLLVQGVSIRKLMLAKVLSIWSIAILLLLLTAIAQWIFMPESFSGDMMLRSILFISAYVLYYWVITALTVYFSARLHNNTAALTTMLALWVVWVIFLPKMMSAVVEDLYPLPSRQDFQAAMREDRSKGIDGHNPSGEREKVLQDSVLNVYQVASIDSLPVNFDGIRMQADEEYGNKVWDKHFGELYKIMGKQKQAYQLSGFVNPFSSLQSLSMGLSGTDNLHHLHFQQTAENYRRELIKALNDEHAFGGSKTGDWGWKAEQAFYNSIEDFTYEQPRIFKYFQVYLPDIFVLLGWVLISLVILIFTRGSFKR